MDAKTTLTLRCTGCGALTDAKCACGVPYAYISPGELAKRAVKDNPGKSDGEIADKLGIGRMTVARARPTCPNGHVDQSPVEKRVGRDGKARRMPTGHRQKYESSRKAVRSNAESSTREIAEKQGVSVDTVERARLAEIARLELLSELAIDPNTLVASSKAKLDSAIRAHKKLLDLDYDRRRAAEIAAHIQKIMPTLQEQQNKAFHAEQTYREFMQRQTKIMTVAEFTLVASLLHPDSRASASEQRLRRAFQMFEPKKFALTGEK